MKKILVTGANSYIGDSFKSYMMQFPELYQVDTLNVIGDAWKQADMSGYEVVFHVAGIAHQKETEENAGLYYQVNRDLAVEIARKAKAEAVEQFVFMSSMSVYGMDHGVITPETETVPVTNYGKSKLEAEKILETMQDAHFTVTILRPPMVYGKGCRGNFQQLLKLVETSPVFPALENQRSMISIRNLCAFVRMVIDRKASGVFCPQNREYVNTTEIARIAARKLGRKVVFSKLAGVGIKVLIPVLPIARKAFSTLIYQDWEQFAFSYCEEDTNTSVKNSI